MKLSKLITIAVAFFLLLLTFSCASSNNNSKYAKRHLPAGSNIALIIDAPESAKNIIITKFMTAGFAVKSINLTELNQNKKNVKDTPISNNTGAALKMDIYMLEAGKAEAIAEMKDKLGVNYLVVMELNDWEKTSWARVIDLRNNELIWLENYTTNYKDNVSSLTDYFIAGMTGRNK